MNLGRFTSLANAYGGDLRRWPPTEQSDAARLIADEPEAAEILRGAAELDRRLSSWRVGPADEDLRRRVVTRLRNPRPPARRPIGVWLPGLGAAGLLASGAVAGAATLTIMSAAAPRLGQEISGPVYDQTSFGDIGPSADAPRDAGAS